MDLSNLDDAALEAEYLKRKEKKDAIQAQWLARQAEELRALDYRMYDLNTFYVQALEWIKAESDAYDMTNLTLSCVGVTTTYDGEKIQLKLSSFDVEVVNIIKTTPSRIYDYSTSINLIDAEEWPELEAKLKVIKHLKIDDSIANTLSTLKREASYTISKNERAFFIECGKKGKSFEIRSIPGCLLDDKSRRWRFPLPEGWRILNLMNSMTAKDPTVTVQWEDEAKIFAEDQLERRLSLDVIAKKEKSDLSISLNGHALKDYQNLSVEFAEAQGNRLMIAHEMGLGKTPVSIALAERMVAKGDGGCILIVCPASLIPNWQRQLIKFTNLTAYRFTGEFPETYDMAMALSHKYRYYIINYDILSSVIKVPEKKEIDEKGDTIVTAAHIRMPWVEVLNTMLRPDMIIADEFHYIQNVTSKRSEAVRLLATPRLIALTGTPFTSYVPQLWPALYVLDKDVAGSNEGFIKFYTHDGKSARSIEELRTVMQPLMFRKTKKEVLPELEPINRIKQFVELSSSARKAYDKVLNEGLMDALNDWNENPQDSKAITSILAQLMALKQIAANDKVDYIADLATQLYDDSGDEVTHKKVIIFTQFVDTPPILGMITKRLGNEAVSFSGHQTPTERMAIIDKFQTDPEIKFLVCSIKAASEGFDITAAGNVIFVDLMWTPAHHVQAEGRAFGRMSDLHSIDSYYVIADNTIEVDIDALLSSKQGTFDNVIEGAETSRQETSVAMELIRALKNGRTGRRK